MIIVFSVPPGRNPLLVLRVAMWDWLGSSAGTQCCRCCRHSWSPPWRGAALSAPHPAGSVHQSGTAASTSEPAATPPGLRKRQRQWSQLMKYRTTPLPDKMMEVRKWLLRFECSLIVCHKHFGLLWMVKVSPSTVLLYTRGLNTTRVVYHTII